MRCLLLFCLFVSGFGFGQSNDFESFNSEINTSISLPRQFKQQTRQTKQRFLRKEYNDTNSLLCQGKLYSKDFSDFRHRYDTALYVHDFDLDGDLDILIFGRLSPGFDVPDVYIYFKERNKYLPQHLGNVATKMNLSRSSTEITVLKIGCCSDFQMEYMYYESVSGIRDSIRQYTHQIFEWTELERPPVKIDTFFILSSEQRLIMSPELTPEDYAIYSEIGVNPEIGTLITGTKIRAYNSYLENGKTWYYIIPNANSEIILNEEWKPNWFGEVKATRGWICLE